MDNVLAPRLGTEEMTPIIQLTVYEATSEDIALKSGDMLSMYRNKKRYYVESVRIRKTDQGLTYGAAIPVTTDVLKDIAAAATPELSRLMRSRNLLKPNLLMLDQRIGQNRMIWYEKSKKRTVLYERKKKHLKAVVQAPAILYYIIGTSLQVFALDSDKKPNLKTKIYHYPLWNIGSNHRVCLGDVEIKHKRVYDYFEQMMEDYTNGFWGSEFNHNQGPYKYPEKFTFKKGIITPEDLIPAGMPTLGKLLGINEKENDQEEDYDPEEDAYLDNGDED